MRRSMTARSKISSSAKLIHWFTCAAAFLSAPSRFVLSEWLATASSAPVLRGRAGGWAVRGQSECAVARVDM